jgi:glycerophosphoryl diester phosphodiesterase
VVVFHDDDLERLGGRPGLVRDLSYDELRTIDLGGGERIPLLVDVLAELGPMLCNVELKTAPHWGGRLVDDGLAGAVADILYRAALQERVLVSSFDPLLLARFRLHAPRVATGLLFAHDQARPYREAWAAPLVRPAAVHPEGALVDARAVARWHGRGFMVNVWTIDDPAEVRLLTVLGVDGIITNRPAATRSMIR